LIRSSASRSRPSCPRRCRGGWAALEAAIIEARQNGKTVDLQVIALHALFLEELVRLIVWTAHLFRTTQEAFRDLDAIIGGTPELARRVKRVSRANGEEGFELKNGRRLNFLARSKTGGRGLTGDKVILDEAFALGPSEMGSLLPTLSARPNPQVVYASSAGLISSEVLRGLRDRGRRGGDASLVYVEWCAPEGDCLQEQCDHRPGVEGCVLDDRERWRQANPAIGRRISIEYVEAERRALPPEEFMRERLTWWDDPAEGEGGISEEDWAACENRDAELAEPVAIGVDAAPMHTSAAIVACGGALHVVEHGRGSAWLVDSLLELKSDHQLLGVALDPAGPIGALIPDLERAGFTIRSKSDPTGELVLLDGRESVQACGAFLREVKDRELVHRDEYVLNQAVKGAGRRQVGDSWKWSRRDSTVDISPLVAATNARFLWVQPEQAGDLELSGELMA
jgi:phage terminase large subunit-like protein